MRRAALEVLRGIEPDADAILDASGAALALIGTALRNGLDRQTLRARARTVTTDAGQTGIDDVANAGDGQGRFGDVGGDDDLPSCRRREDALLFAGTEPPEEWNDLGVAAESPFQQIPRLANVALTGQEDEDVAAVRFVHQLLDVDHCCVDEG